MITVFVQVNGKTEMTEISSATNERLLKKFLVGEISSRQWFLRRVVEDYGSLTEKNILKFMNKK